MIKIIGARRTTILLFLAGFSALVALVTYLLIIPMNGKLESDLNGVQSKISEARTNIEQMKNEFQIIQQQKEQFTKLQATDFFTAQDRVQARDRFTAIQRYSHVLLASYDLKAAQAEHTQTLTDAGQFMLTTPVGVTVDAIDDTDVYNFIYLLKNAFPGYVSITSMDIDREKELDEITLREIGNGMPTVMVKSHINFIWKTIIPEKQLAGATQ